VGIEKGLANGIFVVPGWLNQVDFGVGPNLNPTLIYGSVALEEFQQKS